MKKIRKAIIPAAGLRHSFLTRNQSAAEGNAAHR